MSEAVSDTSWPAIATGSLVQASHKFEFSFLNGNLMVPPDRFIFNCAEAILGGMTTPNIIDGKNIQ